MQAFVCMEAGMTPEEFWTLDMVQFNAFAAHHRTRLERDQERLATLVATIINRTGGDDGKAVTVEDLLGDSSHKTYLEINETPEQFQERLSAHEQIKMMAIAMSQNRVN